MLRRVFVAPGLAYETADLVLDDVTHRKVDLQQMPFPDRSYDMVVCNHVLEHLPDDTAALREIRRILAPRGFAVITVPGDFTRAQTVTYRELYNGHYRDYGMDFADRLREVFTRVEVIDMCERAGNASGLSHAIRSRDLAFVCDP